jgi:nicotinamide mononucleotide transporter
LKRALLWVEILSVAGGLAYTFLLIEGIVWCWLFGFLSAIGFLWLCIQKRLYAESVLQLFYMGTAVLGYLNWGATSGSVQNSLPVLYHAGIIAAAGALTLISGYLLKSLTQAAVPLIDAFTTVFSLFATLLMIYLIPENWIYWIIIDSVSIYLYFKRGLFITAGLFVLYTLMAIYGTIKWLV